MFALGFLVVTAIVVLLLVGITGALPAKLKPYFVVAVIAIPVSFPFWHYLYPSYERFSDLCASPDRYVVKQVKHVDFVYVDGCYAAYVMAKDKPFKGYECPYRLEATPNSAKKVYARFSRGANWGSAICQAECAQRGYYLSWEKSCQEACFDATQIPAPSFNYKSTSSTVQLVEGRLTEHRTQMVGDDGEELATSRDYTYYPYGNGFAKILGLASGSAPTLSCETKKSVYSLDFLKPSVAP